MERFVHSLKMLWRSERLYTKNEIRLGVKKVQFNALAGLVALSGLVMLTLAAFFALSPYLGNALAALAVSGADFVLFAVLIAHARALKPSPEVEMIKEMRDMALSDIEEEVALAEAEIVTLKNDIHKFINNPIDALLPAVGPLLGAVISGLGSSKK